LPNYAGKKLNAIIGTIRMRKFKGNIFSTLKKPYFLF
jgi:hypothetical protein